MPIINRTEGKTCENHFILPWSLNATDSHVTAVFSWFASLQNNISIYCTNDLVLFANEIHLMELRNVLD